jgi:hypothetical protein
MFYAPVLALGLPNIVELFAKFVAGKVRVQNVRSIRGGLQSKFYRNPQEDLAGLSTSVRILTVKAIRDIFCEQKVR